MKLLFNGRPWHKQNHPNVMPHRCGQDHHGASSARTPKRNFFALSLSLALNTGLTLGLLQTASAAGQATVPPIGQGGLATGQGGLAIDQGGLATGQGGLAASQSGMAGSQSSMAAGQGGLTGSQSAAAVNAQTPPSLQSPAANSQPASQSKSEHPGEQGQAATTVLDKTLVADIQAMTALYQQGKYSLAERLGHIVLTKWPTNLDAHYLIGNIYFKLGDLKSSASQYSYCVKTGKNSPVAKLAATALAALNSAETASKKTPRAPANGQANEEKPASLAALKRAEKILDRAQDTLAFKKKQVDMEIVHTEDFARSRIADIPYNTVYRRMSAFGGIEAARDNEDLYTAPNYDRPVEVAKIRANVSAKVHHYIDEYNAQEKAIVTTALKEVDTILGGTSDPDGKPQSTGPVVTSADTKTLKAPSSVIDACSVCGITTHKEGNDQRVIAVATGSVAHRAGLAPGDAIVHSTLAPAGDLLHLTIRRIGKTYALQMHPPLTLQVGATGGASGSHAGPAKPTAPLTPPKLTSSQIAWNQIKDSELVFVEDMSGNMRLPVGDTGLSKWDWAAGRIVDLADSLSKSNSTTYTLIQCYQYVYEIYREQSPSSLRQKLGTSRAMEAANVTTPIINIANEYFDSHSQKPLLLLVFTDGRSERGESLEVAVKTILERAKNADQVRIVFFQIGDDSVGHAMLQMLDNDLTYSGLKHDIVDFVRFDELQDLGLSRALLEAYERPRAPAKTTPPAMSQALVTRLERVRKQMSTAH
jgi:TolA-binding protein